MREHSGINQAPAHNGQALKFLFFWQLPFPRRGYEYRNNGTQGEEAESYAPHICIAAEGVIDKAEQHRKACGDTAADQRIPRDYICRILAAEKVDQHIHGRDYHYTVTEPREDKRDADRLRGIEPHHEHADTAGNAPERDRQLCRHSVGKKAHCKPARNADDRKGAYHSRRFRLPHTAVGKVLHTRIAHGKHRKLREREYEHDKIKAAVSHCLTACPRLCAAEAH